MAELKLPFVIARQDDGTPSTRTSDINHGDVPLNKHLDDLSNQIRNSVRIEVLNIGDYKFLCINTNTDTTQAQTAICGSAVCGLAVCGTH